MNENEYYCPVCQKVITAKEKGEDGSFIFIHDAEINHDINDIEAIGAGKQ